MEFSITKQKLLLEYLISSPPLYARCMHIVKKQYWDDLYHQDTIEFVHNYNDQFNSLPTPAQIEAETSFSCITHEMPESEHTYALNEIEKFCRKKAILILLKNAGEQIHKDELGDLDEELKQAMLISIHRDIGLEYFKDPLARLKKMLEDYETISTGWPIADRVLDGGITRKALLLVLGESNAGKSMLMNNLARNLLTDKYKGVIYTLEMPEEGIAKRTDTMITRIPQGQIFNNIDEVAAKVLMAKHEMGDLFIKFFPASTTNARDIRAHLKELELVRDFKPDFIIIDYIELMSSVAKISKDNTFLKDKYVSEEIRNLGFEFDAMIISASQMNRSAVGSAKHDASMIGGGISKFQTADWTITVRQTDEDKLEEIIQLHWLKTRTSGYRGAKYRMHFDPTSLIISDFDESEFNDDELYSLGLKKRDMAAKPDTKPTTTGFGDSSGPDMEDIDAFINGLG